MLRNVGKCWVNLNFCWLQSKIMRDILKTDKAEDMMSSVFFIRFCQGIDFGLSLLV